MINCTPNVQMNYCPHCGHSLAYWRQPTQAPWEWGLTYRSAQTAQDAQDAQRLAGNGDLSAYCQPGSSTSIQQQNTR